MTDQTSDTNKNNPPKGEPQSSIATEGKKENDVAIDNEGQAESAHANANPLVKPWKIHEVLGKCWDFAKKPESTNVAMAIATIVIAVATVRTWQEIHNGSAQTDKIVTAAQNIQTALDTQNQESQKALRRTLREGRIASRENLGQSKAAMDASNTQSKSVLDATIAASKETLNK